MSGNAKGVVDLPSIISVTARYSLSPSGDQRMTHSEYIQAIEKSYGKKLSEKQKEWAFSYREAVSRRSKGRETYGRGNYDFDHDDYDVWYVTGRD